jgi:hypothetical protein
VKYLNAKCTKEIVSKIKLKGQQRAQHEVCGNKVQAV